MPSGRSRYQYVLDLSRPARELLGRCHGPTHRDSLSPQITMGSLRGNLLFEVSPGGGNPSIRRKDSPQELPPSIRYPGRPRRRGEATTIHSGRRKRTGLWVGVMGPPSVGPEGISLLSIPTPCCPDCLPTHRGDWEIRPNPYLLYGAGSPPCAYCSAVNPPWILTDACPIGRSGLRATGAGSDGPH